MIKTFCDACGDKINGCIYYNTYKEVNGRLMVLKVLETNKADLCGKCKENFIIEWGEGIKREREREK